jgi:hypothetical protein
LPSASSAETSPDLLRLPRVADNSPAVTVTWLFARSTLAVSVLSPTVIAAAPGATDAIEGAAGATEVVETGTVVVVATGATVVRIFATVVVVDLAGAIVG